MSDSSKYKSSNINNDNTNDTSASIIEPLIKTNKKTENKNTNNTMKFNFFQTSSTCTFLKSFNWTINSKR